MATSTYYAASYISIKLGTSLTAVYNWRNGSDHNGFPAPAVSVRGSTGSRPTYGWTEEQVAEIRTWYAQRFGIGKEDASKRWQMIDAGKFFKPRQDKNVCAGQLPLLTIPAQRTGEDSA